MIKEDYLMAILENFFRAIARWLKIIGETPDQQSSALESIYKEFLGHNREFFLAGEPGSIIRCFDGSVNQMQQTEMLAELFYREWQVFDTSSRRKDVALRLLALYDYIDTEKKEYSFERMQRREDIESWLSAQNTRQDA